MSVVTFVMKYFSDTEEVSVYETMKRLRKAERMHVDLGPTIEKYFERKRLLPKFYYHGNVSTMATDGPGIVMIGRPDLTLSMSKVFVEHMHFSMPEGYRPENVSTVFHA